MPLQQKSILWVTGMAFLFVIATGWGFLAVSWDGAQRKPLRDMSSAEARELFQQPGASDAADPMAEFVAVAVMHLPRLPQVIGWHLQHRCWLLILIGSALAAVVAGGVLLQRLQQRLQQAAPAVAPAGESRTAAGWKWRGPIGRGPH